MVNKNRICKLIKDVKTAIGSEDFKAKHSLIPNVFTRNRKMSFQDIVLFVLSLPRKSLPTELDMFFEDRGITISKQAFSKARYKISYQAFEEIFNMSTDIFKFTRQPKTWDGYRVFAIDGSDIAVDHNANNIAEFGLKTNNHCSYPMARLSALYDVTNDLIVDTQFTGISIGEREHARRLLSSDALINNRQYKNLIIFDRGYPSRSLIHELEDKGYSYLMRCYTSFFSCVNECPDGDHIVYDIHNERTTKIRVIKDTTGEDSQIFISNLFGQHQDAAYHQNLYKKRWDIETKYGELKTRIRVENFSGKNPLAIRQELYAAMFISNLSALVKSCVEDGFEDTFFNESHVYQLNRSYIIGAVCRYIKHLMNINDYRKKLDMLLTRTKNMKSVMRPDRHFRRTLGHHGSTNGFYIRVNI